MKLTSRSASPLVPWLQVLAKVEEHANPFKARGGWLLELQQQRRIIVRIIVSYHRKIAIFNVKLPLKSQIGNGKQRPTPWTLRKVDGSYQSL